MRKVIILLFLALSIACCYGAVKEGFEINETLTVSKYTDIEDASKRLDTLISQLVYVNETEYPSKKEKLSSAIKVYQDKKEEYEELQAMVEQNASEEEISLVDIYDVDFLWTTIGNYGTEEGISLKFDIVKSVTSTISSPDYTMCDLKFTISGDYIPITDFIYDIEDDSKLGFEISSFALARGGDNLQATFTVREVPINNRNLTELTTTTDIINKENETTSDKTTETTNTTNTVKDDKSTNTVD